VRGAVLLALTLAVCLVPTVAAHANFLESTPRAGARLLASPPQVDVILSQDVDEAGTYVRVVDGTGRRVDHDDLRVAHAQEPTLSVTLPENLTEGVYRVDWKALSRVDHHTTQESFAFAVGNFTAPAAATANDNPPSLASVLARSVFFVGFLATAATLFERFVARALVPMLVRIERLGWLVLTLGCFMVLADASQRTGLGPGDWTGSSVLRELILRCAAAFATLVAVWTPLPRGRLRAALAGVGLASMAIFSSLSGLALFTYVLVAAPRLGLDDAMVRSIGSRFSTTALWCVIVMALSGTLLGITILGWPTLAKPFAWFRGTYGYALLAKILLALVMIGLATLNRFVFLRRIQRADTPPVEGDRRRFGRFVGGEASVGAIVLVLAALLTSASPPFYGADAEPVLVQGKGEHFLVVMRVDRPPEAGAYSDLLVQITWMQDNSTLMNDTCGRAYGCILLEVVPPGAEEQDEDTEDVHHGGDHHVLEPLGDGWWIVRDVLFSEGGEWELLVEIQTGYVFFDVVQLRLPVSGDAHDEHAGHPM
jgi:methionine-rich copper-binding protein CopC/uncharacterized membrane protein